MNGADIGGLATGTAALLGVLGISPIFGRKLQQERTARERDRREIQAQLNECEDRNADLEFTVGVLIDLLPGGELARRFGLYKQQKPENEKVYTEFITGVRSSHKRRVRKRLRDTGFDATEN